jgi:N-acetylmuramoyl-L-alanine amidase
MAGQKQNSKASEDAGTPVGDGDYVVQPGECIASIAYEHGHFWETILNDPANREVKRARKNHHILLPGDRLTIPPIRRKEVSAETDKLHRFGLKGFPEVFRLRLLDLDDKPRANLRYVLIIEQKTYSGTTDKQGELKHFIPPNARQGRLILGSGEDKEEIELRLGHLNPTTAISGAQARLTNLGIDCGPVDGILGPKTRKAIKRFQKARKLEETGELDGATMQELETRHGS